MEKICDSLRQGGHIVSERYIVALDQGTTSSRALAINESGQIIHVCQKEFRQIYPKPGWVEHDPMDIWQSQKEVTAELIKKIGVDRVVGIGITNQRETTLAWNRETGQPLGNAIVWQDRRTASLCRELAEKGYNESFQEKTGLLSDSYFSATKAKWMLEHRDEIAQLAAKKPEALAFGTVDSWLIWKLTKGKHFVTDMTNASRTLLYNIKNRAWDEELMSLFEIPRASLPEVRDCSADFGSTDPEIFGRDIPICGVAGDQQAATFGQLCIERGMTKNTYGTGCFIVMNTGQDIIKSKHKLLSTIAWSPAGETTYALEGSIFMGGAIVQWLRDQLHFFKNSSDVEELANTVPHSDGVVLMPAFTGLGAPHWDAHARAAIFGMTRGTNRGHIARAALEAIALQSKDVIDAMQQDAGFPIKELRVDGGAVVNNTLMQIQANLLAATVIRPKQLETTGLGAAFFCGLQQGFWQDIDQIRNLWQEDRRFRSNIDQATLKPLLHDWQRAIERTKGWVD